MHKTTQVLFTSKRLISFVFFIFFCAFLTDFPKDNVIHFVCISFIFIYLFIYWKISALWWSYPKNFLNLHWHLSDCLFNILFNYNFCKNMAMAWKFLYVFQLQRFVLSMKNCLCIVVDLFTGHFKNFNSLIISVHF